MTRAAKHDGRREESPIEMMLEATHEKSRDTQQGSAVQSSHQLEESSRITKIAGDESVQGKEDRADAEPGLLKDGYV